MTILPRPLSGLMILGKRRPFLGGVHLHTEAQAQWPRRVGVVPLRADCFQQRDLAATLAEAVGESGSAVLTQVLAGLGGVGKTQLAAQLAEERWAEGELDLLVWITAGTREAIVSGYATAAACVELTFWWLVR